MSFKRSIATTHPPSNNPREKLTPYLHISIVSAGSPYSSLRFRRNQVVERDREMSVGQVRTKLGAGRENLNSLWICDDTHYGSMLAHCHLVKSERTVDLCGYSLRICAGKVSIRGLEARRTDRWRQFSKI